MSGQDPAVSVVIPAYNAAGFIGQTLDSVRAQRYTDYEVIVVDDGSSDATHEVVEGFFAQHRMAGRCIRQPNKRIAAARNTGMRAARGAYIALLDHDDLWYPEKLERVMRAFGRHPESGLICHNQHILREGRLVRLHRNGPATPRMYERLLFAGNVLATSATVFRTDLALAIGGFREDSRFNTVEDYDLWMRLSQVTPFRFLDDVLGAYQVVDRAASSRIAYLHTNLELMLRDHFMRYFGAQPGVLARVRMRRRLSVVYRSAVGQLMERDNADPQQRAYVLRMLRTYPADPKNLARAAQWAARTVWRRALPDRRQATQP